MNDILPIKGLALDYPLRPDFMAQVIVPREISKLEAQRLAAFVMALAQPDPPATQEVAK